MRRCWAEFHYSGAEVTGTSQEAFNGLWHAVDRSAFIKDGTPSIFTPQQRNNVHSGFASLEKSSIQPIIFILNYSWIPEPVIYNLDWMPDYVKFRVKYALKNKSKVFHMYAFPYDHKLHFEFQKHLTYMTRFRVNDAWKKVRRTVHIMHITSFWKLFWKNAIKSKLENFHRNARFRG